MRKQDRDILVLPCVCPSMNCMSSPEPNKMEAINRDRCQRPILCVCVCVCVVTWCHCDFSGLWCIRGRLWRGTARGNVMSSRRAEGEPSVAGSCPFYWVDVWVPGAMAQRVSALPPTCKTQCTHTHTHTRAYQSWPQHRECLPTSLPACLPAGGREAWVAANRDNQCALSCLSCSFMLSLSMRSPGAGVCARHACCLIRGKFHVTFRWRSLKGCFGV